MTNINSAAAKDRRRERWLRLCLLGLGRLLRRPRVKPGEAVFEFREFAGAASTFSRALRRRLTSLITKASSPRLQPTATGTQCTIVYIYVGGCAGLKDLCRAFGQPLYKIGICETGNFEWRMMTLNRVHYSGYIRVEGRWILEPGFDDWGPQHIVVTSLRAGSPVSAGPRSLRVVLPPGLSITDFDAALNYALADRAFNAAVDAAGAYRLDPRTVRYTRYDMGARDRISRACELYRFRPWSDGDRLVARIEAIIAGHLAKQAA